MRGHGYDVPSEFFPDVTVRACTPADEERKAWENRPSQVLWELGLIVVIPLAAGLLLNIAFAFFHIL